MAGGNFVYQYETSPRKLKPEYETRNIKKKKSSKKVKPIKKQQRWK